MTNLDDLREVLASHAERASVQPADADSVIGRARRSRLRRRSAVGLAGVVAAGAIALPFALGLGQPTDDAPPQGTGTTDPAPDPWAEGGWVEDLPGLDLPAGDALGVAYADENVLYVGEKAYNFPGSITQVIDSPEGPVVIAYDRPLPARQPGIPPEDATRTITLLVDDGRTVDYRVVATGNIDRLVVGSTPTGATRLAWVGYARADGQLCELGSTVLGADETPALLGASDVRQLEIVDGEVLVASALGGVQEVLSRWDLASSSLVPISDLDYGLDVLAFGIGGDPSLGLFTRSAGDRQCVVAAPMASPSATSWEYCDAPFMNVSPDGTLGTDGHAIVDLRTGESVLELDVGVPRWDMADPRPERTADPAGWLPQEVLISVGYTPPQAVHTTSADNGDGEIIYTTPSYVVLRCSLSTGACSRVPHPVGAVAEPAA